MHCLNAIEYYKRAVVFQIVLLSGLYIPETMWFC